MDAPSVRSFCRSGIAYRRGSFRLISLKSRQPIARDARTGRPCYFLGGDTSLESFNLDAPPGFRGLHPDLPVRAYHRNLPHWRQAGATYFVTFRLADALPQAQVDYLQRLRTEWERTHPSPRTEADWTDYARQVTDYAEHWSDQGHGACWFKEPKWAEELRTRLLHFQNQQYFLSCLVVMPNHCHLVMRPFDGVELEDILQAAKSMTSRAINKDRGDTGTLWQQESYDRIVRDEEHLWQVIQYIGRNPKTAGFADETWRRWIAPEWEKLGWKFWDE